MEHSFADMHCLTKEAWRWKPLRSCETLLVFDQGHCLDQSLNYVREIFPQDPFLVKKQKVCPCMPKILEVLSPIPPIIDAVACTKASLVSFSKKGLKIPCVDFIVNLLREESSREKNMTLYSSFVNHGSEESMRDNDTWWPRYIPG